MARPRSRPKKRTRCPSCDEPLDGNLADEANPDCPACGEHLLPVRVAPVWRRAAAATIDLGILLGTAGLLNWGLLRLLDLPPLWGDAKGLDALLRVFELTPGQVIGRIAPFLVMAALYFGLFWSITGRTVGAKMLDLRVVDAKGRRPHPLRVSVRVVAHFLSGLPGALGWIWAAFDLEKRAWHDHVAQTYVVRDR
jgi:uncharacterized RDD family membrane protein YckC